MMSRPSVSFANPFLLWGTLGVEAMQMSTAAAQVIAMRTTRMAAARLNPNGRRPPRDDTRMGAKKVDAFSRAGQALATGAVPLLAGMAAQAWRTSFDLINAATRLAASRTHAAVDGAPAPARRHADAQRAVGPARGDLRRRRAPGASRAGPRASARPPPTRSG